MAEALTANVRSQPGELVQKSVYSASEVQLAMRLMLAKRSNAKRVLNRTILSGEEEVSYEHIPVTGDNLDWAYHVFEKMVYTPSWHVVFT